MTARLGASVGYVHLVMVAGIVVTAVGNELVIAHPTGRTPATWAIVLLGGPALYVAGRAGFEYTIFARVSWNRPVGLVVLLALIPAALHAPLVAAVIAATGVLTGIVISDAVRSRRNAIAASYRLVMTSRPPRAPAQARGPTPCPAGRSGNWCPARWRW